MSDLSQRLRNVRFVSCVLFVSNVYYVRFVRSWRYGWIWVDTAGMSELSLAAEVPYQLGCYTSLGVIEIQPVDSGRDVISGSGKLLISSLTCQ